MELLIVARLYFSITICAFLVMLTYTYSLKKKTLQYVSKINVWNWLFELFGFPSPTTYYSSFTLMEYSHIGKRNQGIGNSAQNYCNSQKIYWILQYAIIDPLKNYCNNCNNAIVFYQKKYTLISTAHHPNI